MHKTLVYTRYAASGPLEFLRFTEVHSQRRIKRNRIREAVFGRNIFHTGAMLLCFCEVRKINVISQNNSLGVFRSTFILCWYILTRKQDKCFGTDYFLMRRDAACTSTDPVTFLPPRDSISSYDSSFNKQQCLINNAEVLFENKAQYSIHLFSVTV